MRKLIAPLCYALALATMVPCTGYSRNNRARNNPPPKSTPNPTPQPTPKPAPSPTPEPVTPGAILNIGADFITVSGGKTPTPRTYKVTRYTQVALNGQATPFTSLRRGMTALVTPTSDQIYANAISATSAP